MNSIKEIMGMDIQTVRALGVEAGLNFHEGLKKSEMAKQLSAHAASSWVEVNKELMSEEPEQFGSLAGWPNDGDNTPHYELNHFGDEAAHSISDAARIATMVDNAGYTNTFHDVMGSGSIHAHEAINTYLGGLGVDAESVWKQLPRANSNLPTEPFKKMQAYLRDNLVSHQDMMPQLPGYAGDDNNPLEFMKEYATNKGDVHESWKTLADLYIDKQAYNNHSDYEHDVSHVAAKLASKSSQQLIEVAYANANGEKTGYHNILPQLGDSSVVRHVKHAREPLNAAGLPLGSTGSAVGDRAGYSLISSLTGMPYSKKNPIDSALSEEIGSTLRSLAQTYRSGGKNKSDVGMNPYAAVPEADDNNYSALMDEATRTMDVADARSAYNQLDSEIKPYTTHALSVMMQSRGELMESESRSTYDPALASRSLVRPRKIETFSPEVIPQSEHKPDFVENSNVQYHDKLEQGTPEWHAMRNNYDITGSMVGAALGNNMYTRPWKALTQKLGFDAPKENKDMRRGHALEPIARERVSGELGIPIKEVGAITNSDYPNMMYSPDGLIGDDAIWEHKAPRHFSDLHKDHPDYVDQMQLGMLLSGRKRALYSQTVDDETKSQWVDFDPDWYSKNELKLKSISARLNSGRLAITNGEQNDYDVTSKETRDIARKAMEGSGLWGDIKTTSGHRQTANAGTEQDEFLRSSNPVENAIQENVTTASSDGAETGMAKAVKEGVLAADEERKRRQEVAGAGSDSSGKQSGASVVSEDADSVVDNTPIQSNRRNRGGGGSGGGSGGFGGGSSSFGRAGNAALYGLQSGSMDGLGSGLKMAVASMGAPGKLAVAAYGLTNIVGEGIEAMNEYSGVAQDYGLTSGVQFAGQQQSLEMLGLSRSQAMQNAANVHSVYNRMANSDFSGAVQIVQATRGLLTFDDISRSQGDPATLAVTFREKAQAAGWSQSQAAGAAQMAGLPGFARTLNTSGEIVGSAMDNDIEQTNVDQSKANDGFRSANATRASNSKDYLPQRIAAIGTNGTIGVVENISKGFENLSAEAKKYMGMSTLDRNTIILESGGDPHAVNTKSSAKGLYQILRGTAKDPGIPGVKGTNDTSFEALNLAGHNYLQGLLNKFNGDEELAAAAHVQGPNAVMAVYDKYQDDWLNHVSPDARKRVYAMRDLNSKLGTVESNSQAAQLRKVNSQFTAGANTFQASSQPSVGNLTVNINASVNGQEARATAQVQGGQSITQVVNMNGKASQSR